MARRVIIRTTCPLCGKQVEPGMNDAEMVVTRSGCKQYIHSSCWYSMIAEQKKLRKENRLKPKKENRYELKEDYV